MFNPIFIPNINSIHECSLKIFTESITEYIVPSEVKIYAYRIGAGCLHVLKLDDQLEITITDGGTDIPDKSNCLDYLRVGHIQIGVLDSMDVTYMINHLLNALKAKNEDLNCFYRQHDER
uniref:Uncharacterized protein n=1 Tax=Vibrio tasmaniensis TaxID=212663 RepID=A0A0H4A4D6_9VIBR|nr:hypothetical protein [Vibrio tasmaniensis]AKN40731.1 hypothetical protein [Vibrio tasmaniensis]